MIEIPMIEIPVLSFIIYNAILGSWACMIILYLWRRK